MGLLSYLQECLEVTKTIKSNLGELMATAQEFRDTLKEIGTEVDRITELVKASDLTGAEEQEILDGLKGLRDRVVSVKAPSVEPPVEPSAGSRR